MSEAPQGAGEAARSPAGHLVPKHRMLALTDGVTAIAMTLLVLDIELPSGLRGAELDRALGEVPSQVGRSCSARWSSPCSGGPTTPHWRARSGSTSGSSGSTSPSSPWCP
ncbi:TMEM175 family protein [Streptomyces cinnamoneus]|uniref:TMEM175 family protein n=1 Tax=Streptomyces cinnamoneus TaxID=53446 RepID=UPI001EFC6DDD|nr:TMEM175 family protein [Streptomyces cinnamoneus]